MIGSRIFLLRRKRDDFIMYIFHNILKEELDIFMLSIETIPTSSSMISDRKKNHIIRTITRIQNIFFSFKNAIDSINNPYDSINCHNELDNAMNTLFSVRESISKLNPSTLKIILKGAVNTIQMCNAQYAYSVDAHYTYFDNYGGGPPCIDLYSLYQNIYRIMDSVSDITRDMNILVTYPFAKQYFKGFVDNLPESFSKHAVNIYAINPAIAQTLTDDYKDIVKQSIHINLSSLRTTTEAFDIVIYRPYFVDLRNDKVFDQIKRCIRTTRKNGLFIAELPSASLTEELLSFVKDLLKDFHVTNYKMTYGTVLLYGIRKLRQDDTDIRSIHDVNEFLYDLPNKTETEMGPVFFEQHAYPITFKEVSLFQGQYITEQEISELKEKSTQIPDALSEISMIKQEQANPLLPFTKEQLGIILTSGVLNGVIDEGDRKKHLIKGVVIKEPVCTEEKNETNNEVVQKIVYRNQIKLKILQPNGNFVELT